MKNGYSIFWTAHALTELKSTINYLEENFTHRELNYLSNQLEHTLNLISRNPELFPQSTLRSSVRKAVVAKFNNLYYQIDGDHITILSFFSNRQDPLTTKI
ncbi:type II toxin-antitoxin system RelE/ParE family toxin [Leeuwenhoekiella sp. H156]|uniref:type II toxin-antitoxin system RelE/ParE family toxin n=1 Tax=Leeuwenhoekiella sp. H156 TaxID=3450128 RepID=UPI003FA4D2A8